MKLITWSDENRQRVIDHKSVPALVAKVRDQKLTPIIIPVLLNLCLDYGKPLHRGQELTTTADREEEKAQQNCMEHRLDLELFEVISSDHFTKVEGYQALVCHICKLLEMLLLWRTLV